MGDLKYNVNNLLIYNLDRVISSSGELLEYTGNNLR